MKTLLAPKVGIIVLPLMAIIGLLAADAPPDNPLPPVGAARPPMTPEARAAAITKFKADRAATYSAILAPLQNASAATLYSLEPGMGDNPGAQQFHHFTILGQIDLDIAKAKTVTEVFASAINGGKPSDGDLGISMALCFDPRHGLRVETDSHTYDYVLCYECGHVQVFEDDKEIADVNIVGKPKVLNDLLEAAKIPLAGGLTSAQVEAQQRQKDDRVKQEQDNEARWLAAAPKPIQPLWAQVNTHIMPTRWPDDQVFADALAKEFPETNAQIKALLSWYGSGAGQWSGFPAYEQKAEELLSYYSTAQLVAAIQAGPLTDAQLEGAARALADFRSSFNSAAVPPDVKAKLTEHMRNSKFPDNVRRAERVLGPIEPAAPAPAAATGAQ